MIKDIRKEEAQVITEKTASSSDPVEKKR